MNADLNIKEIKVEAVALFPENATELDIKEMEAKLLADNHNIIKRTEKNDPRGYGFLVLITKEK